MPAFPITEVELATAAPAGIAMPLVRWPMMVKSDPTDDDIYQANSVILVDAPRHWEEIVGPSRHLPPAGDRSRHDLGYILRIPVDVKVADAIQKLRDRINCIRVNGSSK